MSALRWAVVALLIGSSAGSSTVLAQGTGQTIMPAPTGSSGPPEPIGNPGAPVATGHFDPSIRQGVTPAAPRGVIIVPRRRH